MMDSGNWNEETNRMSELEETVWKLKEKNQKLKEKIRGNEKENEGNLSESDKEYENSEKKQINALEVCKKDDFKGKEPFSISKEIEEKVEKIENYYLMTQVKIQLFLKAKVFLQLEVNKYEFQTEDLRKTVEGNQKEIKELRSVLIKAKLI